MALKPSFSSIRQMVSRRLSSSSMTKMVCCISSRLTNCRREYGRARNRLPEKVRWYCPRYLRDFSQMGYFKHPTAIVETEHVGEGTRIWAYAHVLAGARIGKDCNLCDHTFIENDVVVGDRVTIKCGVQLWDGVHLEN